MKGVFDFDLAAFDAGDATIAARRAIREWMDTDWFEPSELPDEALRELFVEHQTIAHAHLPDEFPLTIEVRCVAGGGEDFERWCASVRERSSQARWDWRYGPLKRLALGHSEAHASTLRAWFQSRSLVPGPGKLWLRYGDQIFWRSLWPEFPGALSQAKSFYCRYAQNDVLDAVNWQLAEPQSKLADNPFWPLLRCYGAGAYPFSLGKNEAALFRFRA